MPVRQRELMLDVRRLLGVGNFARVAEYFNRLGGFVVSSHGLLYARIISVEKHEDSILPQSLSRTIRVHKMMGGIVEIIRDAGAAHPHHPNRELNMYCRRYHHSKNPNAATESPLSVTGGEIIAKLPWRRQLKTRFPSDFQIASLDCCDCMVEPIHSWPCSRLHQLEWLSLSENYSRASR